MLEIKATEAADAGEWKCVAISNGDANSVSTCQVKMASKLMFSVTYTILILPAVFQFQNITENQDLWKA